MQRIWLALTPIMFLILWSAGYVVAKVALVDAAPMALLALRFAAVIAIMAVLFAILRPPLPKTPKDWLHLGLVGFLMQTVYFGVAYFAFVNGVAAGMAALIFSLQTLLVGLAGAAMERRNGKLAVMAGLGNCYDWNLCGDCRPA